MIELTSEQKKFLHKIWKLKKPKYLTYLELIVLYKELLKLCMKHKVDPQEIDFESVVDWDLTYYEALGELKDRFFIEAPMPSELELKEAEYWKTRAEKLESRIERLRKVTPADKIEKLHGILEEIWKQIKERKERVREVEKPITKERLQRATHRIESRISAALISLEERIRMLEEKPRPAVRVVKKKKPLRITELKGRPKWLLDFLKAASRANECLDSYMVENPETGELIKYTNSKGALDLAKTFVKEHGGEVKVWRLEVCPNVIRQYWECEVTPLGVTPIGELVREESI